MEQNEKYLFSFEGILCEICMLKKAAPVAKGC